MPTWTSALVTGASSGIGDALARRLARDGTALVVVARDEAKLRTLAGDLPVDVEVLAADLSRADDLARVEARLADDSRPVDLLVNNAGFGTVGPFVDQDVDEETREIAVNVTAPFRLSRAVLPGMVARGSGAIMNVSSMAGSQPTPNNAVYGASKAFLTAFTESIHEELRGTGVTATAVLPGFTRTEFQERAGLTDDAGLPGFVWMSAEAVADAAVDGTAAGRAVVVPGLGYKIASALAGPVPRSLKRRAVGLMSRRF